MNRLLRLLVLLPLLAFGADQNGAGQEDADEDMPPPTLPLLHNAAAPASWTIIAKVNPGQTPLKFRYLAQQTVAKGSQIRGIVNRWSDGTSTECWIADGFNLSGKTGSSNILVYNLSVRWLANPYVDYSRTDFPELSWISLANYAGIRPYHGRKCYAFKMNGGHEKEDSRKNEPPPATPASMAIPRPMPGPAGATGIVDKTAYVDVATHLPVAVSDGLLTQEYVFAPSASEPIMPDGFAARLKSIQAETAALYRRQ